MRLLLESKATIIPDFKPSTINDALFDLLIPHAGIIQSITADNGFEFNDWEAVKYVLSCEFFFCHPYSSWERGTVENTNGLIRRFYPKKTDFNLADKKRFDDNITKLNHRPRKCLGFESPNALLFDCDEYWADENVLQLLLESKDLNSKSNYKAASKLNKDGQPSYPFSANKKGDQ